MGDAYPGGGHILATVRTWVLRSSTEEQFPLIAPPHNRPSYHSPLTGGVIGSSDKAVRTLANRSASANGSSRNRLQVSRLLRKRTGWDWPPASAGATGG